MQLNTYGLGMRLTPTGNEIIVEH